MSHFLKQYYKDKPGEYLYHYSKELYNELKSLRAQERLSKKELDELDNEYTRPHSAGKYTQNISFFIEPIPYKIIGDLFNNNEIWVNGQKLYQYKIPLFYIEKRIKFSLVETPEDIKLFDNEYSETMTNEEYNLFIEKKAKNKVARGEVGEGRDNLIKAIKPFLGTTEKYFIEARKRPDADITSKQYAANVPHLMLYPTKGIINYESYSVITIGED